METYIHEILQNIADKLDSSGSGVIGGRRRRVGRPKKRRGGCDFPEASGSGLYGTGLYGMGKRRFNIGKYNKALKNGYSEAEAKKKARM